MPRSAEYTFFALKASLNPPIVITKIAKTRIRTSISVIKIRFLDGLKLSRTNTRHICSLVMKA